MVIIVTTQAADSPRRRAGLVQERSRETRRRLVRAAMHLWTERGFETGIDDTTADEIAQAAGVTKGTFYFHFARKEEILLELGFETAALMCEEAARCVAAHREVDDAVNRVAQTLVRSVKAAPPAAVSRAMAEFYRPRRTEIDETEPTYAQAFELLMTAAQAAGEITDGVPAAEIAQILEALYVDSVTEWARGRLRHLNATLRTRSAIVLAGLRPNNPLWD